MRQSVLFNPAECKPLSPEEKVKYKEMHKMRREKAFLNAIKERSEKLEIWLKKGMSIDRQKTFDEKHYWVEDLLLKSNKKVWAVCIQCGNGRWVKYVQYRDLCSSCKYTDETCKKISESHIGENNPCYGRTGKKHPMFGKHHTEETLKKMIKSHLGKKPTEESRIKQSCTVRGISVEEFDGFAKYGKYCPKFNDTLKERIRDKYNRRCLLCGISEDDHIKKYGQKLSIHHVDYNKECGCDGNECRLVPLCSACHGKTSGVHRGYWEELIMNKIIEIFPDINFDNPQTNIEDFYTTPHEMKHQVKISNLVKSIISQCVNYPPNPQLSHQRSLFDF